MPPCPQAARKILVWYGISVGWVELAGLLSAASSVTLFVIIPRWLPSQLSGRGFMEPTRVLVEVVIAFGAIGCLWFAAHFPRWRGCHDLDQNGGAIEVNRKAWLYT